MIATLKAKNANVISIETDKRQNPHFHKIGAMIVNLMRKYRKRKLEEGVIEFRHQEEDEPFYIEVLE